jgi:hypothetical protein
LQGRYFCGIIYSIVSSIDPGIMSSISSKVAENKVRRAAERQGLLLQKSRRRDPRAIDYGGYMLVDQEKNFAVFGAHPNAYSASLEEVADFLKSPKKKSR